MVVLITGPVRSGKSARAAHIAQELGRPITFVATARVDETDAEMVERVARHRADRRDMTLVELWQPGAADLPAVVAAAVPDHTLLVDSLGTWVAGHLLDLELLAERDPARALERLAERTDPLLDLLPGARANLIFVGEETGWGVVPVSPLGRIFRDHLGRLAQRIASRADRVELVVAGYALDLKSAGVPIGAPLSQRPANEARLGRARSRRRTAGAQG